MKKQRKPEQWSRWYMLETQYQETYYSDSIMTYEDLIVGDNFTVARRVLRYEIKETKGENDNFCLIKPY